MTDFIRNLVLRGSGSVPMVEVQPASLPQFPPSLTLGAWRDQTPFPAPPTPPQATSLPKVGPAPSPEDASGTGVKGFHPSAAAEPAVQMGRSSPPAPDVIPIVRQPAPPAASTGHPPRALVPPSQPGPTLPTPAPLRDPATAPPSLVGAAAPAPLPVKVTPGISPPEKRQVSRLQATSLLPNAEPASPVVQTGNLPEMPQAESTAPKPDRPRRSRRLTNGAAPIFETSQSFPAVEPPSRPEARTVLLSEPPPANTSPMVRSPEQLIVQPVLPASWQAIPQLEPESPGLHPSLKPAVPLAASPVMASPPGVEVHIGTVELRAVQPSVSSPPPAPKPQGFDAYAHLRGWEGE
jgi:hypothetical protein